MADQDASDPEAMEAEPTQIWEPGDCNDEEA